MARDPALITTLVDDFNRADTGPPPGPLWTTPLWSGESGLRVVSNQLATSASSWRGDYITTPVSGVQVGFRVRLAAVAGTIHGYLATTGLGASPSGYSVRWSSGLLQVFRWDSGSGTLLKSASVSIGAGSWIALIRDASGVEGFYSTDGVTWTSIGGLASDTTHTGNAVVGLESDSTTVRWDDLYYDDASGGGAPAGPPRGSLALLGVGR